MTKQAERHWSELREESVLEVYQTRSRQLRPLTANQAKYLKAVETSTVTLCTGPAGTGKSYMACGIAARMLREGRCERVVLSRPLAECDEEVGTEPGDMMDKVAGVMQPMLDALRDFVPRHELARLFREEKLAVVPLARMRGRTFHDSFVLLDEAQNATLRQLRMFLTRFGRNARVVVNGDHTQSDLPYRGRPNSLLEVIHRLSPGRHPSVAIVRLGRGDIVRHELIQHIEERLGPREGGGEYHQQGGWKALPCPACKTALRYEAAAERAEESVLRCCHCGAHVELLDEDGFPDPVVLDASDDGPCFETHPEGP